MITKIEFVEEVDNTPFKDAYDDYSQGTTWTNWSIYRLVNDDGNDQYIKIGKVFNSYGDQNDSTPPKLTQPKKVQVTAWE